MKKIITFVMMGVFLYTQNIFGMMRSDYQKVQKDIKSKANATAIQEVKKLGQETSVGDDSGALSKISKEPDSQNGIVSSSKVFDMNEPVGVAGGGASSGEGFVPLSKLSKEEKERLEERRKRHKEDVKNRFAIKEDRTTDVVIINNYSEINGHMRVMRARVRNVLNSKQVLLCTKSSFLATKKLDNFVVPQGYVCKEVNDCYLLFVPEAMQRSDQPMHIQNRFVGLNFSGLPDYNYAAVDQNEFDRIKENSLSITKSSFSGIILLLTLQKLQIKDVLPGLLPNFNMYLAGHGCPGVIADISAKSPAANKPSDFLKVMQLFDKGFRTKSVGLFSCYLGGKQNVNTYSMYDQDGRPVFNKYNNALLENLSYPIINMGSLYAPIYAFLDFDFVQYFGWLNAEVPEYEKILNYVRFKSIDNWISIKFPHTSWFSPVELKNKSETLSQVAMSTRETAVDIKPETEVIILQANYIPQPVEIHNIYSVSFMPVNYHYQSYYFKSLRIIDRLKSAIFDQLQSLISGQLKSTIFGQLTSLIFGNVRVGEEINFAFELLQINNRVYKNVHCFVNKRQKSQPAITGCVYEDPQGHVFSYSWPAQKPLEDVFVNVNILNKEKWAQDFRKLSDSIYDKVPESLRPDFINKLKNELLRSIDFRTISIEGLKNLLNDPNFIKNVSSWDIGQINPEILSQALYYRISNTLPLNFVTKLNIAQISQIVNDHTGIHFRNIGTSYQENFTDKAKRYMEQENYAFERRSIDVTGIPEDYVQHEGLDDGSTEDEEHQRQLQPEHNRAVEVV